MNSNFKPILGCFTIIGVIFTILGVIVAIVALFKPAAITVVLQGILPEPTPVIVVVPSPTPTRQLGPTNTPTLPPTPIPTATPVLDTPEGTILEVGEKWKQEGVALSLDKIEFEPPNKFRAFFTFYNNTDHELILTVKEDFFLAVDNIGNKWRLVWPQILPWVGPAVRSEFSEIVESGGKHGGWRVTFGGGDLTRPELSEIIVIVDGISKIKNARWRIPVYH